VLVDVSGCTLEVLLINNTDDPCSGCCSPSDPIRGASGNFASVTCTGEIQADPFGISSWYDFGICPSDGDWYVHPNGT